MHKQPESLPTPLPRDADWESFTGSVETSDEETVDFWRGASPEAHGQAMIDLSNYAEMMAITTGFRKDQAEHFPGLRASGLAGDARTR